MGAIAAATISAYLVLVLILCGATEITIHTRHRYDQMSGRALLSPTNPRAPPTTRSKNDNTQPAHRHQRHRSRHNHRDPSKTLAALHDDVITLEIQGHNPFTGTVIAPQPSVDPLVVIADAFLESGNQSRINRPQQIALNKINGIHVW